MNAEISKSLICIDNRLYCGTDGGGVFLSMDTGQTWIQINSGLLNWYITSLSSGETGHIFAVTPSGVFRSIDYGAHWTEVNNGLTTQNVRCLARTGNGYLFAGTYNGGVYRSSDNGDTWNQVSNGLTNLNISSISIESNNDVLVANYFAPVGLFCSTDLGTSWTNIPGIRGSAILSLLSTINGNIFIGNLGGPVDRSTNGGNSWHEVLIAGADVTTLGTDSYGLIYVGTAGRGLYVSRDSGNSGTWIAENVGLTNLSITSFATDSVQKLFLGTRGAGVWRRPLSEFISPKLQLSTTTMFFGSIKVGQFKDTTITVTNIGTDTLKISNIVSSNTAFWARLTTKNIPPSQSFADTLRFTPSAIGTTSGTLLVSSNALSSPDTIKVFGFCFGTPIMQFNTKAIFFGELKVGTSKDTILTITNTGNDTLKISNIASSRSTFTARPTLRNIAPGQSFADTLRFAPTSVGTDSTLIVIQSNSANSPDTIKVSGIAIPTTGVEAALELPTIFSLSQNYPNPFNPSTTIAFDIPARSQVTLKIYDLLGREVAALVTNETMSAGSYTTQWNAANLSSGIYFYRLQAGSYVGTKKLVLLK